MLHKYKDLCGTRLVRSLAARTALIYITEILIVVTLIQLENIFSEEICKALNKINNV